MVSEVVQFLTAYEIWIYAILGLVALGFLSRLFKAIAYWRDATFGIEKEIAKRRFINAGMTLVVLFVFAISEFFFVSFSASSLPNMQVILTPTIDVLATATPTLPPEENSALSELPQPSPTPQPDTCIPGQVNWISPEVGDQISDVVPLVGEVNIPNFGFYKYEYAAVGSDLWTTIAGGNKINEDNEIGSWNTTQLLAGDYLLRLVVLDNQNNEFGSCVVGVRVINP
jgi:hypothetical protein